MQDSDLKKCYLKAIMDIMERTDFYKLMETQDKIGYFSDSDIPQEIMVIVDKYDGLIDLYKPYIFTRNSLYVKNISSYFGND